MALLNSGGTLRDVTRIKELLFNWASSIESGTVAVDLTNIVESGESYVPVITGSVGNRQIRLIRFDEMPWTSPEVPIGSITKYVGNDPPETWLVRDGSELLKSAYPALYAVLGSLFGETATHFRLPDDRGLFDRNLNSSPSGIDPNRVLGSYQQGSLQSHAHDTAMYPRNYVTSGGGLTPAMYWDGAFHGYNTLNSGSGSGANGNYPPNRAYLPIIKAYNL